MIYCIYNFKHNAILKKFKNFKRIHSFYCNIRIKIEITYMCYYLLNIFRGYTLMYYMVSKMYYINITCIKKYWVLIYGSNISLI